MPPDRFYRGPHQRGRVRDRAVRPGEVLAPGGAKHARSLLGLTLPDLGRAVRAEFSSRQVAEADSMAFRRLPRHGATEANLDVVRMRTKDEQVDGHALRLYLMERRLEGVKA